MNVVIGYWIILITVVIFILLWFDIIVNKDPKPPIVDPPITPTPVPPAPEPAPEPEPEPEPEPVSPEPKPEPDLQSSLDIFETYHNSTLPFVFSQKAEKILNPNRQWDPVNGFVSLRPWTNVEHFGTFCHTMIGYAVRYTDPSDSMFADPNLAANLITNLELLSKNLPDNPPHQNAPWGAIADWYHFSITMPEVYMTVTCCLKLTPYHYKAKQLTDIYLGKYLPTATFSLGWVRTAGNAMRMGVPYIYSELVRGRSFEEIYAQNSVQDVLKIIAFPYVKEGNGLHLDSIYIDHINVRAYGYLINSFFTFNYYMFCFGENVLNYEGLTKSILKVSCPEGIVNPSLMSRQVVLYSNVIGNFVEYKIASYIAEHSKVLTKITKDYYGCAVGYTNRLAYYEADPTNFNHALIWAMNRRLWRRDKEIFYYFPQTLNFESGVLLLNLNGEWPVPSTTTSTESFVPTIGKSALLKNEDVAIMLSYAKIKEFKDLEFKSFTLYYEGGMLQFYYDMRLPIDAININPRMVIMPRPQAITDDPPWSTLSNYNTATFNGVTCRHFNVINQPGLSNFVLRTINNFNIIEQIVSRSDLENGIGRSGYVLQTTNESMPTLFNTNGNRYYIKINDNNIEFDYPYVYMLYGEDYFVLSSVEEDTELSVEIIQNLIAHFTRNEFLPVNCVLINNSYVINTEDLHFKFRIIN
ncbi:ODV-E66 [Adoxophyes orana nucleopolyhedrovirus]|uniref:ODV-E66 n=1 Tax=Adoxophyes orana nucleopolyhedrovirus TaxID=542343 RepID=UPI0001829BFF|nr:ODV-E66 [Adoxophyes orana nucleopolyhedrovirus]ACF05339.1 ODV-E66 [Adoxophyes orana nucleopolyhedrovirus]